MPIFLLIKKPKMYKPNDNCNTCLVTMTTIVQMSSLRFRKIFYFICSNKLIILFPTSLFQIHITNFVLNLSSILSSSLLKRVAGMNILVRFKSTITKAKDFAGAASIDTHTMRKTFSF